MVAPTPVSALLHSATMVNLGVYILLRFSPLVATVPSMGLALTLVGGFSFLVTSVLALRHSNAKRVLAYSTVANLALIVVCVGIGTPLAIAAGMLILIYHAVSKALLFLTVGVVKHETGSEDIENMTELRQRMPMLAISLYSGVFLMVLPAFGLFAGKWMLSEASLESLPFLFLFAVAIAVPMAYYAKWLGRAMASGPTEKWSPVKWSEPSPWFTLPLLVLIGAAFAMALGLPYVIDTLVTPYLTTYTTRSDSGRPVGPDHAVRLPASGPPVPDRPYPIARLLLYHKTDQGGAFPGLHLWRGRELQGGGQLPVQRVQGKSPPGDQRRHRDRFALVPHRHGHFRGGAGMIEWYFGLALFLLTLPAIGLLLGFDRKLTARLQNRVGPPIWQPILDLAKLFDKEGLLMNKGQVVFALMGLLLQASAMGLLCMGGDLLVIFFLSGAGSFMLVLGAFSALSPFSHLGAHRELLQIVAYEPVFFLAIIAVGWYEGTFMVDSLEGNLHRRASLGGAGPRPGADDQDAEIAP